MHERQRADLLSLHRDKEIAIAKELEARNLKLEKRVSEVTEAHLSSQDELRDLYDKLGEAVTHDVYDALK